MKTISELQIILSKFYHAFHLPISLYEGKRCITSYVPIAFSPDPAYRFLEKALSEHPKPLSYTSHNGIHCGYICIQDTEHYILIGPVSAFPCTSQQLDNVLKELSLPFPYKKNLSYWLKRVPVTNITDFLSILRFLDYIINEKTNTLMDTNFQDTIESLPYPIIHDFDVHHRSQQIERTVLSAITIGDYDTLQQHLLQINDNIFTSGSIGKNALQVFQNLVVVTATLSSRAAIQGGMDYEYALTLSDYYIQKGLTITDENEMKPLIGSIMVNFCTYIANLKKPHNISPLTSAVISYIHAHIYQKFSVADIAKHLGYSATFLSHTFKTDMNQSIKQYMQEKKMDAADQLISTEKRSISETAAILGYSSQSHFQAAYKKIRGTTPGTAKII